MIFKNDIEILNKEKPSEEAIKRYEEKIEDILTPQKVNIKLIIRDYPMEWWSSTNGVLDEHWMNWIDGVKISTPEISELFVHLYSRDSVLDEMNHHDIWLDALEIQNAIYRHLGRQSGSPKDGDVYWKLWDRLAS